MNTDISPATLTRLGYDGLGGGNAECPENLRFASRSATRFYILTPTSSTPSTFLGRGASDILRTGQHSDSRHNSHVHKLIIPFSSPVFHAMFTSPQPPHQTRLSASPTPPPSSTSLTPRKPRMSSCDLSIRESPTKIGDLPVLTAVFPVVERYKIASM